MPLKQLEKLHQGQRWSSFPGFIAGEGIDAPAENFSGLALIEIELLAHVGYVAGIDIGGVYLLVERLHLTHNALGLRHVGDGLIARGAKVGRHRRNRGRFALVRIR